MILTNTEAQRLCQSVPEGIVLGYLKGRASDGIARPSLSDIVSDTKLSRTKVCHAIKELEEAGILKRNRTSDGGDHAPTEYVLL